MSEQPLPLETILYSLSFLDDAKYIQVVRSDAILYRNANDLNFRQLRYIYNRITRKYHERAWKLLRLTHQFIQRATVTDLTLYVDYAETHETWKIYSVCVLKKLLENRDSYNAKRLFDVRYCGCQNIRTLINYGWLDIQKLQQFWVEWQGQDMSYEEFCNRLAPIIPFHYFPEIRQVIPARTVQLGGFRGYVYYRFWECLIPRNQAKEARYQLLTELITRSV